MLLSWAESLDNETRLWSRLLSHVTSSMPDMQGCTLIADICEPTMLDTETEKKKK